MSDKKHAFTVYPAIDLRRGQVVRLMQGDPTRQTVYSNSPFETAWRWLVAGASWLHVVNLDGALGEWNGYTENLASLGMILTVARQATPPVRVQYGGGLRSFADIERVLALGVSRVILGTAAIEHPGVLEKALNSFGSERVGVSLDVLGDRLRVRGWKDETGLSPMQLGKTCRRLGVRIAVYTNIAHDGGGRGLELGAARRLALQTGLEVIVAAGVNSVEDVRLAREARLSGVIIGRALYEGQVQLSEALQC